MFEYDDSLRGYDSWDTSVCVLYLMIQDVEEKFQDQTTRKRAGM